MCLLEVLLCVELLMAFCLQVRQLSMDYQQQMHWHQQKKLFNGSIGEHAGESTAWSVQRCRTEARHMLMARPRSPPHQVTFDTTEAHNSDVNEAERKGMFDDSAALRERLPLILEELETNFYFVGVVVSWRGILQYV